MVFAMHRLEKPWRLRVSNSHAAFATAGSGRRRGVLGVIESATVCQVRLAPGIQDTAPGWIDVTIAAFLVLFSRMCRRRRSGSRINDQPQEQYSTKQCAGPGNDDGAHDISRPEFFDAFHSTCLSVVSSGCFALLSTALKSLPWWRLANRGQSARQDFSMA
jgi:hypothetical protein